MKRFRGNIEGRFRAFRENDPAVWSRYTKAKAAKRLSGVLGRVVKPWEVSYIVLMGKFQQKELKQGDLDQVVPILEQSSKNPRQGIIMQILGWPKNFIHAWRLMRQFNEVIVDYHSENPLLEIKENKARGRILRSVARVFFEADMNIIHVSGSTETFRNQQTNRFRVSPFEPLNIVTTRPIASVNAPLKTFIERPVADFIRDYANAIEDSKKQSVADNNWEVMTDLIHEFSSAQFRRMVGPLWHIPGLNLAARMAHDIFVGNYNKRIFGKE